MDKSLKDFSLRIEPEMLEKFHFIAQYEGRSANKEMLQLIKKRIAEFEKEHGPIKNE